MDDGSLAPDVGIATFGESKWSSLEYRKKCFYYMLVFLPLISLPFIMSLPDILEIHYDVICRYLNIDSDVCSSSGDVNQYIARMSNVSSLATTVPAIIMIPIVTAFVEKIGLKWGLMFVISGYGSQLLLMYPMAYWLPSQWSPYRMLALELFSILMAVSALPNFFLLAINQLFPEAELRPVYVGRFMGASSVVGLVGPALGSLVSQQMKIGNFFLMISCFYLIFTGMFIYIVELPPLTSTIDADMNIHSSSNEGYARLGKENKKGWFLKNLSAQMRSLKVLSYGNLPSLSLRLTGILITVWIALFSNMDSGDMQVFMLYGKQHFGWHQGSVGVSMTVMALAELMCSVVIFPLLQKFLLRFYQVRADAVDSIDKFFMELAIVSNALGFVIMGAATNSVVFFIGFYIFGHASLAKVVAKPALLKLVPSDETASLITALSVMERISSTVVPVSLLYIYEETLNSWPALLFQVQTILNLGFLLLCYLFIRTK